MSETASADTTTSQSVSGTVKALAMTNGLLGLWLLVAPFLWSAPNVDLWNDIAVGALVIGFAGYNYYREMEGKPASRGSAAVNVALGLWLIAAPFVFGLNGAPLWNDVVVGTAITLLAGYNWGAGDFETSRGTPSA